MENFDWQEKRNGEYLNIKGDRLNVTLLYYKKNSKNGLSAIYQYPSAYGATTKIDEFTGKSDMERIGKRIKFIKGNIRKKLENKSMIEINKILSENEIFSKYRIKETKEELRIYKEDKLIGYQCESCVAMANIIKDAIYCSFVNKKELDSVTLEIKKIINGQKK